VRYQEYDEIIMKDDKAQWFKLVSGCLSWGELEPLKRLKVFKCDS